MSAIANDNSTPARRDQMPARRSPSRLPDRTWVLVAGDFHRAGGMDRANAEFAAYLCSIGATVHLVSHRVEDELAAHPKVRIHLAKRTGGVHFLAQRHLDQLGRTIAAQVISCTPGARVLVNGVNC